MRNLEEFNNKHTGQKCVVLASGPSLIEQDFSLLKNFVTIAVNSAYVAYESNYFISDDWSIIHWSFMENLKKSNKTIVLLYEDKLNKCSSLFGERAVLFRHRLRYHITDHYSHSDKENHIVQCRTSVGSAIHVAHIMGCKEILVLGLDCSRYGNYRWFWQLPTWQNKPYRLDGKKADQYYRRKSLQCNSDVDLIDILSYWEQQGHYFNDKCKVYNGSRRSLVKVFPYMSLKDFAEK